MSTHHLGRKYSCYSCHTKFYDLGKATPVCPKCGADQRDADDTPAAPSHRGRRVVEPPPPPPLEPEFDVEEPEFGAEESAVEAEVEEEELEAQQEAPPVPGEEEKEDDEEEDEEF